MRCKYLAWMVWIAFMGFLLANSALAVPFEVTYKFEGGFHIFGHPPVPQVNGFDYYFTPLALDSSLRGEDVTIQSIEVSSFGHNQGDVINWDWEVYLGPSPFGLPEGQFIQTLVDPVAGYVRSAPTQLHFVIGSRPDTQSYLFSGQYDFLRNMITVNPYLSVLTAAFTSPMDLPDGLYAQLFFWTADNRNVNIGFDEVTLIVRGDIANPAVVPVTIDIKPGEFPNSINPKSQGVIPVAILTTNTFDATTVNAATVRFGAIGTEAAPVRIAVEDVNSDGFSDLLLFFNTQNTGIQCRDTSASLTGQTFSGQKIEGTDAITTVGCR